MIGGWHFAAIQRYNSGSPVPVTLNNCETCGFNVGNVQRPNKIGNGSISGTFNPSVPYWNQAAWSNQTATPSTALTFGNEARTDPNIRDFPVYNEDFNLFKEFPIHREDVKFRLEMAAGNALNRHYFCTPNSSIGNGSFGIVTGQCNQPRHFDFGAKLSW